MQRALQSVYYRLVRLVFLIGSFVHGVSIYNKLGDGELIGPMTGILPIDISLAIDFVLQVVAYGAGRYFRDWTFFKLAYGLSFIYCFEAYRLNHFIYKPIDIAIRCYRIIILIKVFSSS